MFSNNNFFYLKYAKSVKLLSKICNFLYHLLLLAHDAAALNNICIIRNSRS